MVDQRRYASSSKRSTRSPTKPNKHEQGLSHRKPHGNNASIFDQEEIEYRKVSTQQVIIALAARATFILNSRSEPEVLDLRPYASELNDALLNELANQLKANMKRTEKVTGSHGHPTNLRFSTIIISGCEKFTPVGMRSFVHAIGSIIRHLDYSKTIMSIEVLKVMATCIERLEVLDFSSCPKLLSEGVHEFITCCNASLTKLNLSRCSSLNDDALGWIAGTLGSQGSLTRCTKLVSLDISYTKSISDRGLIALGTGCHTIQFINLEGLDRISCAGILKVLQGCKMLRVLNLKTCMQLTDTTLVYIGQHGRNLRSLNIAGCYSLSSVGLLSMVTGTPLLQSLNLEGCLNMREDILAAVATSCLSLQVLNLNGCQEITDNGITTLAEHLPFVQKASAYRGLEPKTDTLQLKLSVQQKTILNSAALCLQAYYRGYRGRKLAASWREQMIEIPACKKIRKSYVCWKLNRSINDRVRRTKLVNNSVVKIQSLARGILCRAALARAQVEDERIQQWSIYAIKIQAAYRSHWTRKHFHVVFKTIERYRKEQAILQKEAAATRIQRAFQAQFNRSRLDDLIAINQIRRQERNNAAITIQRLFRSRASRKAYRQLRAAMEQLREKQRELIRYAIRIQSQWRGHRGRMELIHIRAAKEREDKHKHDAASRINAGVRGYFGRRVAYQERVLQQTRLHAVMVIQRTWRLYKTPSVERINFENMLRRMKAQVVEESYAAMQKQEELLKKTRILLDRDSASEPESDEDWRDFEDENGDQFWFSPSHNQRLYIRPNDYGYEKCMLGMACRVYWPLEEQWFNGKITKYNRSKDKHRIDYDDGDHEWMCLHVEGDRIQLFNGYCWCMVSMFEPSLRMKRAALYLTLRFQQYDHRYLGWRSGVIMAYDEQSDTCLLEYDNDGDGSENRMKDWVNIFQNENTIQVQDAITLHWYSLSGYAFGRVRGRPLNMMLNASKTQEAYYYSVEDYLSYVDEVIEEPHDGFTDNGGVETNDDSFADVVPTEVSVTKVSDTINDEDESPHIDEDEDKEDGSDESESGNEYNSDSDQEDEGDENDDDESDDD